MGEPLRDQYIVLPSNVKHLDGEKINKPNDFKVPLDRPLELDKTKWEVALAEINYPCSWEKSIKSSKLSYSFIKANFKWIRTRPHQTGLIIPEGWRGDSIHVPAKTVSNRNLFSVDDVVKYLNDIKPDEYDGDFVLSSNKRNMKIKLRGGEKIQLNKQLKTLLGFNDIIISERNENAVLTNPSSKVDPNAEVRSKPPHKQIFKITAPKRIDMDESKYNMFVYSNLCENTIVGNTQVPLLRTIPITGKERSIRYISHYFEDKRYIPLSSNFFQAIEIKITDEYGELIDFRYGKVIVTLHLRHIEK